MNARHLYTIILAIVAFISVKMDCYSNEYSIATDRLKSNCNPIKKKLIRLDEQSIEISDINSDTNYDCIIKITNQEEFNDLSRTIPLHLKLYKNILVEIEDGTYFSKSNHILLKDVLKPNCRISIKGKNNVTIMATSFNLREGSEQHTDNNVTNKYANTKLNPNERRRETNFSISH